MEKRYRLPAKGHTFDRTIEQANGDFGLSVEDILISGKHSHRVNAHSVAACLAVRKLGLDGTAVGKRLGTGQSAISRAVTRGEKMMVELEIPLP